MRNVAGAGRTVLFVSHNFGAVKELCDTTVVLHRGEVLFRGPVVAGLTRCGQLYSEDTESADRGGGWDSVHVLSHGRDSLATIEGGDEVSVQANFVAGAEFRSGKFIWQIRDALGNTLAHQRVSCDDVTDLPIRRGRYTVRVDLPALWLAPGAYSTYFKFLGTQVDGVEKRYVSDAAVLDVGGSSEGISQAFLAPPRRWRVTLQQSEPAAVPAVLS
jgi:lipopolysaccharide transport system ATP-binding protein